MKVGIRTPSVKKSFKARTTGRIKRAAKKSINPLYGKKGMGYLTDPERAVNNKIYHAVTVDPLNSVKTSINTANKQNNQVKKRGFRPRYILLIMSILSLMALLMDISSRSGNTVFWSVSIFIYFAIYLIMRKNGL